MVFDHDQHPDGDQSPSDDDAVTAAPLLPRRSLLRAASVGAAGLSVLGAGGSAVTAQEEAPEETSTSTQQVQTTQLQKLTASDGEAYEYFGWSVAVADNIALIGTPTDDDNGGGSGSAYVFRYDGSQWDQQAKLLASDGDTNDSFGWSVALTDNIALIGAPFDDGPGGYAGSAYVFRYDGSQWTQQTTLTGAASTHFGWSVAVVGDVALIGAPFDDDNSFLSGSASVFRYDGSQWDQQAKLLASDGEAYELFGYAVAVADTTGLISAPFDDANGAASGSAYVFDVDAEPTPFEAPITLPSGRQLTPVDHDGDGLFEDLDGDGDVDGDDLALLSQLVAAYQQGQITLTPAQIAALDFNGDGKLTPADITAYTRRYL